MRVIAFLLLALMSSFIVVERILADSIDSKCCQNLPTPQSPDDSTFPQDSIDHYCSSEIETGCVVIDGEILAAPYVIEGVGEQIFVNSQLIDGTLDQTILSTVGETVTARSRVRRLVTSLESNGLIVSVSDERVVFWSLVQQGALLHEIATNPVRRERAIDALLVHVPATADALRWQNWVMRFAPNAALSRQLLIGGQISDVSGESIGGLSAKEQQVLRSFSKGNSPSEDLLLVAGFVLTVVALGHLLQFRLDQRPHESSMTTSSSAHRGIPELGPMVWKSVLFMAVFSSMDLVWTMQALQAGIMREVNPLAEQLIDNPAALVGFKTAATALSAGILVRLRTHRPAQIASWWLCLVCTVLTFRWLSFHSMTA